MSEILVKEYRGDLAENLHRGFITVVDKSKNTVAHLGDINKIVYYRSTAKPIQVLPVLTSGAANKFNFTEEELALMASSHSGEEVHLNLLKDILNKLELGINDLQCGTHPPYSKETRKYLKENNLSLTPTHNACSGKHAAQLALSKFYNLNITNYFQRDHFVQKLTLKTIAEVAEYPEEEIYMGIDSCGVLVFGLPIKNIAYSYCKLLNNELMNNKYQEAAHKITQAMINNPVLVAGSNRFGTILSKLTKKDILIKSGADGFFAFAFSDKGVAIKIEDGNLKSAYPVILEVLKQYNFISEEELTRLNNYYNYEITDHKNRKVGYITPEFSLN